MPISQTRQNDRPRVTRQSTANWLGRTAATAALLLITAGTSPVSADALPINKRAMDGATLSADTKSSPTDMPTALESSERLEPWPVPVERVPVVKPAPTPNPVPSEMVGGDAEPKSNPYHQAPGEPQDAVASRQLPSYAKRMRRQIDNWPDRQASFANPRSWTAPQRATAANIPPSALAITRTAAICNSTDMPFYDRLDLALPRKRGFTLVAFEAEPLNPELAATLMVPVEAIAVDSDSGDESTAFLDAADQVRIRPPLFRRWGANMPMADCWSGYRLTITLEGPIGVDPFGPVFSRPDHRKDR